MRKTNFILVCVFIFYSLLLAVDLGTGTTVISSAGTYEAKAAGTYTLNMSLPSNAYNKKFTTIELIGGGGGGAGGDGADGASGGATSFAGYSAPGGGGGFGGNRSGDCDSCGGWAGSDTGNNGGNGSRTSSNKSGGPGAAGWYTDGLYSQNGYDGPTSTGKFGAAGWGYGGGGGGGGGYSYGGGGGGASGSRIVASNVGATASSYSLVVGSGGGPGAGGFGANAGTTGWGGTGAHGYAKIAISYSIDSVLPTAPGITRSHTGWTNSNPTFTLGAGSDSQSGLSAQQYSLNGGSWTAYTTGKVVTISTDGTHTLRTRSIDNVGNVSALNSATVYRDTAAPVAPAFGGTTSGAYNTDQSFTLSGETDAVIQYSLNGGSWTTYTSAVPLNTADGTSTTYAFKGRQIDQAGNISAETATYTVIINKSIPGTVSLGGTTSGIYNTTRSFTLSGDSGSTLQYSLNGGAWTVCSGEVVLPGADGASTTYTFKARQIDTANNISPETGVYTVVIDRAAPVAPVQLPDKLFQATGNIGKIDFADSSDVGSGIQQYEYYWGNDSNGTDTKLLSESEYTPAVLTAPGVYFLRVRAVDVAGNSSNWQTVQIYQYSPAAAGVLAFEDHEENILTNLQGVTEANLTKREGDNTKIGQIVLNKDDLGVSTLSEKDFSTVVIDKDSDGNPFVAVPEGSDLATAVNGNNKWVPIKLGPFTQKPIIKYSADGTTWETVVDYEGNPTSTNIRNYLFADNYVTFEVSHFSTYGTAVLNSIEFTEPDVITTSYGVTKLITVNVLDNMGEGVENAPVTFSIQAGGGLLNGGSADVLIYTNASGIATVNYTFPNQQGTNIVKAAVDEIFGTISLKIPGGLTAQETILYNTWAAGYPGIGDQMDDPDQDGITNLLEWNYGVDSTNPNNPDTDNDGINDKWDAYPNDNSQTVFNSDYTAATVNAQTFSGSAKGGNVLAASSNLVINTTVDTNYSKNATQDSIIDDSRSVLEINGLAFESVRDGNLAFASGNYSEDLYRSLYPNETYSVLLTYLNRGNDTDTLTATVNLEQSPEERWSVQYGNSGLTGVAPWQLASLEVMVLPTSALAYEKTTLNIDLGYAAGEARLVTSYNAFTGAYLGNSYNSAGAYGGLESFSYTFQLEAQGFELKVVSRSIEVTPPPHYNGVSVSAGEMVPGTKIKYSIGIQNESFSRAPSINLKDNIPNNCHLFYTDTPNVVNAERWEWNGATSNVSAADDAVFFVISIPARETVTCSYTVTLD